MKPTPLTRGRGTIRGLIARMFLRSMAASLALLPASVARSAEPAPRPDVVRGQVIAAADRVTSIEITYTAAPIQKLPNATSSRHHVAQKGRLRYAENSHFTDRVGADADLNHTRMFFTEKTFDVFYVKSRYYETSAKNATLVFPWKVRVNPLLVAVGWWPKGDDTPPDTLDLTPFRPLRFLVADPACGFAASEADGKPCVMIGRPGRERVWLDPGLGWAVRRHEVFHPKTGALVTRATPSGFAPHALPDGHPIWFPTLVRMDAFDPTAPADAPSLQSELRVEQVAFNAVVDDLFVFRPPPGTLIQDRDTQIISHVPGGRELLDEALTTARAFTGQSGGPPPEGATGLRPQAAWLVIGLAAVAPIGLGLVVTRRAGGRAGPGAPI